jgi:hypothetical protein
LTVENIDTRIKPKYFFRNLFIALIVLFILLRVLKTKGKDNLSLLSRIFLALKGVKMAKN